MDVEQSGEVLEVPQTQEQEEVAVEKEVIVTKMDVTQESTEPENPPAAAEEPEPPTVNGHSKLSEVEELTRTTDEGPEIEDSQSKDVPEPESKPDIVPEPEPENVAEIVPVVTQVVDISPAKETEQPVTEETPEPVIVQSPLQESAPLTEPLKAEVEMVPEPVPEKAPSPSKEEKVVEPVEPTVSTAVEEVVAENVVEDKTEAEPVKMEEVTEPVKVEEKVVETVTMEEKVVETVTVEEKLVETVTEKKDSVETVKVVESVTQAVAVEKVAESPVAEIPSEKKTEAVEGAPEEPVEDKNEAEAAPVEQKEEPTEPASGSLSFAFLERVPAKEALQSARTLVVLRGLPGSGKSFLARAISEAYKENCSVISADDHGVKPEKPSAESYKALDQAVVSCCSTTTFSMIVVDDTNHTQDRLATLEEIGEEHHLVVLHLEPRTNWCRDLAELHEKSRRGLDAAIMQTMDCEFEKVSLPLFFGWFFHYAVEDKVKSSVMDFLKTLDTLEAFNKHMAEFGGKPEKEVDLEQYFKAKGRLHCTTKFCDYGKVEGSKEYGCSQNVQESLGRMSVLSLSALFVTPRTFGARVSLTEEQLLIWPTDAEKEADPTVPGASSLPLGSRAHVTLGCADGVEPVQTGFDLLQILTLQQSGQEGELVEEMELGSLRYFGEGRWMLTLKEPICAPACFSSYYGRGQPAPMKKEGEKKKKSKCSIL
ncbi:2',3'-cyclic-nucleotide 3'-phosphodiesterase [Synchiropus splendidus]|uniref:2',3'-cyclic-nucleotide 3'-phosphodiesterase n=1 Tax=Synchiropus splendidus TaxID=270530 RepID=UPI00237EAC6C|nr:2',3'-cyclic-nucleotide 3'-phosphodiesterase [Synchiropus splendidus]